MLRVEWRVQRAPLQPLPVHLPEPRRLLEPLNEAAQVEIETENSKQFIIFQFQVLSSRRFQLGFDRVNLHRLTLIPSFSIPRRLLGFFSSRPWMNDLSLGLNTVVPPAVVAISEGNLRGPCTTMVFSSASDLASQGTLPEM